MSIKDFKEYANSKKKKIKDEAIKTASALLVTGMLVSGLTGCQGDPNREPVDAEPDWPIEPVPVEPVPSTDYRDYFNHPYYPIAFDYPLEEYSPKEKLDIYFQNYMEQRGLTYYTRVALEDRQKLDSQEHYTILSFEDKHSTLGEIKVQEKFFNDFKQFKGLENDYNRVEVDIKDKEALDYIFNELYINHNQETRRKTKENEILQNCETFAGRLAIYNELYCQNQRSMGEYLSQTYPYDISKIELLSEIDKDYVGRDDKLATYLTLYCNGRKKINYDKNGECIGYEYRTAKTQIKVSYELFDRYKKLFGAQNYKPVVIDRNEDYEKFENVARLVYNYLSVYNPINIEEKER